MRMEITVFIKKEVKKSKSGKKTYIRIVESYRANGKNKHRSEVLSKKD
jgi:hypothetical protein